eukprot:2449008-Alexandrium_andersonii.AAC.1
MPDALFITHCVFIARPPEHVDRGSHLVDLLTTPMVRAITMDELAPVITRDPDGVLVYGGSPAKAMEYQRRDDRMSQEGRNHRS